MINNNEQPSPSNFTVMVVDDEENTIYVIRHILEKEGYNVVTCSNGTDTLTYVQSNTPDLILLDVLLPDIDGFNTCREIKKLPNAKEIPVIFISNLDCDDEEAKGFLAGGVDFINKPIKDITLISRINIHIKLKYQHQLLLKKNAELLSKTEALKEELLRKQQAEEELKAMEKQAREAEQQYKKLFEDAPVMYVTTVDKNGEPVIEDCNKCFLETLGYEKNNVIGVPLANFYSEKSKAFLRQGGYKKDRLNGVNEVERTLIKSDGTDLQTHLKASPKVSQQGDNGTLAMYVDFSARIKAEKEKEKLINQLHQAQKMEAIGTLAGGIAHDFNNILAAILGFASLAREKVKEDSSLAVDLDRVISAGVRAKELVKQILAFSRQSEVERILLQPSSIIKEAIKMLRPSLPSTIEMRESIDSNAGIIMADPTHIHQILMNLCTNAFHAMEETGGILNISLTRVELTQKDIGKESISPGPYIKLGVSDNGPGIDKKILPKIFDPYFTTKEKGKGTGLGLAVIHGIVSSYDGLITVNNKEGEGVEFNLFFPIIEHSITTHPEIVETVIGGNERILFVDDEEIMGEMGEEMLGSLGYYVVVKNRSIEALELFSTMPDYFNLVITDMTMPLLTGEKLSQMILEIRPDIPIIICTGYSNLISEEKAKAIGIKELIMKPFIKKDMAKLIRQVLDGK